MSEEVDWYAWHAPYDELTSPQTVRLAAVQQLVGRFLDTAPLRPLRVLSLAAGQSRELLPLLVEHPRGRDVQARLVELDPRNADFAEGAALGAALPGVEVLVGDAGLVDVFAGAAPADLLLACGLFELLSDEDRGSAVAALPQLCGPGARVLWTLDATQDHPSVAALEAHFTKAGFLTSATASGSPDDVPYVVVESRLVGEPATLRKGTRLFSVR